MRVKRQNGKKARTPTHPGWYPDGSGLLRYFDGKSWTERLRDHPSYQNIPEFENLPPYVHKVEIPRKGRILRRKIIGAVAALALIATGVSQLGSIWYPPQITISNFVPLVNDQSFVDRASKICVSTVSKTDSLALTGAFLNAKHSGFSTLASPYLDLSAKGYRRAIAHNKLLYRHLSAALAKFTSLPPAPGSQPAVTAWQNAWRQAVSDLGAYNADLGAHSQSARTLYHSTERALEWINVFSTANQITGCSVFSTELFS